MTFIGHYFPQVIDQLFFRQWKRSEDDSMDMDSIIFFVPVSLLIPNLILCLCILGYTSHPSLLYENCK